MTKRASAYVVAALLAVPLVAGCGSSSSSDTSTSPSSSAGTGSGSQEESGAETVKTASTDLGTFLVDGEGKTLYLFEQDRTSKSTCNGACLEDWPAVTTDGAPQAGDGVTAAMLGTSRRGDGTSQVTYAGHPLYYFAGDSSTGDTNGQEVDAYGAEWYVLGTNGEAVEGHGGGGGESGDDESGGGGSSSSGY
jgi:predicted lipoprotein with Yx(FWY)xxD motif